MGGRGEDKGNGAPACGKVEVPTAEELAALDAMRNIKKRARELKSRLSEIVSGAAGEKRGEAEALAEELERLKREWESWEQKRERAAHERMVLLGHEEPSRED